ncbi:hypothetical protein P7C70_g9041, partial [Phenoliferia sp. Uapishka_3]
MNSEHPTTIPTDNIPTDNAPMLNYEVPFHASYSAEPPQERRDNTYTRGTSNTRTFNFDGDELYHRAPHGRIEIPKVKLDKFRGENVSRFLKRFEMEFKSRGSNERIMAEYLPMYVKDEWFTMISDLPGYDTRDWHTLKRSMLDTFEDEEKHKYSLGSLREFVSDQKKRGRPDKLSKISKVYFEFNEISSYLKKRHIIGNQEESRYFLSLLPRDLVDMIYARRETRHLVKIAGELIDDDEEGAIPDLREIIKEIRAIYANFAKRGKLSKIRSRRAFSTSGSDSDGISNSDASDSDSSEDGNRHRHTRKARSSGSTRGSTKYPKSSKSSDSEHPIERMKIPKKKPEPSEDSMKDLLMKFSEMQVTMAQLAQQPATQGLPNGTQQQPFPARRNSFGNGNRPPGPGNPNTNQWNAPRREAPPHQANSQVYENNYANRYAGTGSNAIPVASTSTNPWAGRLPAAQYQSNYNSNYVGGGTNTVPPAPGSSNPWTNRQPPIEEPRTPICLWCAGEDGNPHWMNGCKDLQDALAAGAVRKDFDGKLRYGARFIPSRGNLRGMRGWVKSMEEMALAQARPQDTNVHFNTEVKTNSIEYEYDPPEVAEDHCEYESGNIRVDEFEVNQTKRPRSATSTDNVPLKTRSNRNYRPRESLFEELGVPRAGEMSDKENDTEMKDVPKRRQPQPATPKPKLESPVEAKSDPRAFLDKVLEQPITVPMHFMLANSPELVKMLMNECKRKRTPVSEHDVNHLGWDEKGRRDPKVNAYKFEGPRKPYYAGVLAFANIMIEGE